MRNSSRAEAGEDGMKTTGSEGEKSQELSHLDARGAELEQGGRNANWEPLLIRAESAHQI